MPERLCRPVIRYRIRRDVSAGVYESSSALTDYGYEAPLRMYVNDYNEGVALSRAGLRTPDFECLAKRGIDVGTVCR